MCRSGATRTTIPDLTHIRGPHRQASFYLQTGASTEEAKCTACSSSINWYIGPLLVFVFALVGGGLSYAYAEQLTAYLEAHEERIADLSTKFTLVFVTLQILELLSENRKTVGGAEIPVSSR